MADRLSNAQLERLGKRLIATEQPAAADLALLHELLLSRSEQLERSIARVHDALGLSPSSRVKNTGTILEKLRRQGGWTLGGMQDLAGMRVVGDFDLDGQDVVVVQLRDLFSGATRPPKVIDRREEPMHGYRAVHVIVFPDGAPLEIQVRTARQHEWAELFEKVADLVGRGIRYGEPQRPWWSEVSSVDYAPAELAEIGEQIVELALLLATRIADLEEMEVALPDAAALQGARRLVDALIDQFHKVTESLERVVRWS